MRDVQTILGHAHLSTTAEVYLIEDEAEVIRRVQRHLRRAAARAATPAAGAAGYDGDDLAVLLGGARNDHVTTARHVPARPSRRRRGPHARRR